MISKNRIKTIHALAMHKHRKATGLFVAEGHKIINELIPYFSLEYLGATTLINGQTDLLSKEELAKASLLKTPQNSIAIFRIPKWESPILKEGELVLALDGVQDPGNLGTIVRLADWFGIEHIICSNDTVDIWNPKSIQATMGAIARVKVHYTDLKEWITSQAEKGTPVYGTFLDGENLYSKNIKREGIIVMGNEGNGISPDIRSIISDKILIPNFPEGRATSESLNVAVATAIICAEFRRPLSK